MLDVTQIAEDEDIAAILADIQTTVLVNGEKVWTSDAMRLGQQSAKMFTAARYQMNGVCEEVGDEDVVKDVNAHSGRQSDGSCWPDTVQHLSSSTDNTSTGRVTMISQIQSITRLLM